MGVTGTSRWRNQASATCADERPVSRATVATCATIAFDLSLTSRALSRHCCSSRRPPVLTSSEYLPLSQPPASGDHADQSRRDDSGATTVWKVLALNSGTLQNSAGVHGDMPKSIIVAGSPVHNGERPIMFHDRPFPFGILELVNTENLPEDTVAPPPSPRAIVPTTRVALLPRREPSRRSVRLGARARTARTRSLWCRWKRIRRNHPGR